MAHTFGFLLTLASAFLFSQAGSAANADLINAALNQNLQERDQVTGTYLENVAADRPALADAGRGEDTRIAVELESGLTSSSRPLRDHDNRSRLYREPRVEANLDNEVKAVDRAVDRAFNHSDSQPTNPSKGG